MRSRVQRTRRGVRRTIAVAGLGLIALGTLTAFVVQLPNAVAIDGVALSDAEISVAEDRVQRIVQQQDGTEAALDSAAIEALRDDFALFSVARDAGASDIERPADLIERLDDVNREREAARETGEVVYGPVSYDLRTFYGKALSEVRSAVAEALDDADVISEDDIRARFDQDSTEWTASATTYRLTGVRLTAAQPVPDQTTAMTTEGFERVLSAADPASLVSIDATSADLESGSWSPEQADLIRASAPGSVIGPMPAEGAWIVYRLDHVDVDDESAYDTYRIRIREQLLEELLDQRISAERETQVITGR